MLWLSCVCMPFTAQRAATCKYCSFRLAFAACRCSWSRHKHTTSAKRPQAVRIRQHTKHHTSSISSVHAGLQKYHLTDERKLSSFRAVRCLVVDLSGWRHADSPEVCACSPRVSRPIHTLHHRPATTRVAPSQTGVLLLVRVSVSSCNHFQFLLAAANRNSRLCTAKPNDQRLMTNDQ